MNQRLEKNLGLVAFDYFPLFKASSSKVKGEEVTILNYVKITLCEEDKIYNSSQTEYNFPNESYQFFKYKEFSFLIEMESINPSKIYINLSADYGKKNRKKI